MKIAIFLPNWIGDAVMATPTLRAIRRHFLDEEIVGVMRPYVADVLAGLHTIDRTILFDPRGKDPAQRGWRVISQLRQEKFRMAILLPNSFRTGLMASLSGARRRVGFRRDMRGWLLTDGVIPKPKTDPHPVLDEYLRLAEHLGCADRPRRMELVTLPEDEKRLKDFWKTQDPRLCAQGVICLNPGGAFGAAKHWPAEHFSELARRLAETQSKTILVLCGPAEREQARQIVRDARHPSVTSLANVEPSIGLTKAAVKSAELLITTDSGPRHFAPPFGVPVVTLFGPTHIAWSETGYEKAVHLQLKMDCGPCQQRECPLAHHDCMRLLTPDQVFHTAVQMLKRFRLPPSIAS
jgi:heptosyltransferase-2